MKEERLKKNSYDSYKIENELKNNLIMVPVIDLRCALESIRSLLNKIDDTKLDHSTIGVLNEIINYLCLAERVLRHLEDNGYDGYEKDEEDEEDEDLN